jgi:hypothetical protein
VSPATGLVAKCWQELQINAVAESVIDACDSHGSDVNVLRETPINCCGRRKTTGDNDDRRVNWAKCPQNTSMITVATMYRICRSDR